jgi:hypothetical protein
VADVSSAHVVGVPEQFVAPLDQEHPYSAEQADCVAFPLHGVTDPEHVELHEHPYCVAHAAGDPSELQDERVPVHAPAVQLQLYWDEHSDAVVIDAQAVSVPVQGVFHMHPALVQRFDEAYDEHADGVPLHTYSARLAL